jgi:hypothetical protein
MTSGCAVTQAKNTRLDRIVAIKVSKTKYGERFVGDN